MGQPGFPGINGIPVSKHHFFFLVPATFAVTAVAVVSAETDVRQPHPLPSPVSEKLQEKMQFTGAVHIMQTTMTINIRYITRNLREYPGIHAKCIDLQTYICA